MPQSEFWPFMRNKPNEAEDVDITGPSLLLQKQLGDMEGEVKEIQMELAAIKGGRHDPYKKEEALHDPDVIVKHVNNDDAGINKPYNVIYSKEKPEVSRLRYELSRAKNIAEGERLQRLKYEAKLNDLELKINSICNAGKTSDLKESQKVSDEVVALKTQLRDMKEETEELRITVNEKTENLQEYRVKYLQAQQQVEELKRQMDVMDFDSKQSSDQIQIELQKMKMQFQEKLMELSPLPDLLKGAQIQLQEAKQLQRLAEENSQQISNELYRVKEKLVIAVNNVNQEKIENTKLLEDNISQKNNLDEKQLETEELYKEIGDYKCQVLRLKEKLYQLEARYDDKAVEFSRLVKVMEELKEESGRSLTRTKGRSESTRHYLQTQIAELEKQIITCRAQCRVYQKERDELRQRMQIQIVSLKDNLELVGSRLHVLQGQLVLLKNYCSVILPGEVEEHVDPEYPDT